MNNSIFTSTFYAHPSKLRTTIVAGMFTLFLVVVMLILNLLLPYLIHSGAEVTVPTLIGKDIKKGSAMLSDLGLQIQEVKEVYSGQAPAGIILNQNPLPNSVVREGRRL
ncbi:MAG: PASTA domain-containing protein [Candidatus Kapaibacterium sp.]